jgi:hypothetical protein
MKSKTVWNSANYKIEPPNQNSKAPTAARVSAWRCADFPVSSSAIIRRIKASISSIDPQDIALQRFFLLSGSRRVAREMALFLTQQFFLRSISHRTSTNSRHVQARERTLRTGHELHIIVIHVKAVELKNEKQKLFESQ